MLDDLDTVRVCYSLGIGPDVSWDLGMAERGATIDQYDHTVLRPPVAHPRFRHVRIGVAVGAGLRRLDTLIRDNGHTDRDDMIVKVDIEGHKWEALDALDTESFGRFKQIVVEFHGLGLLCQQSFLQCAHRLFAKLRDHNEVIHLHSNNFSGMRDVQGLMLPDCLEVSFADKQHYRFVRSHEHLPGPLDAGNNPDLPDLLLGVFTAPPLQAGTDTPAADPREHLAAVMAEAGGNTASAVIAAPDDLLAATRHPPGDGESRRALPPARASQRCLPAVAGAAGQGRRLVQPIRAGSADIGRHPARGDGPRLARAICHLRERMTDCAWHWQESPATINTVTLLTAGLHFAAAWGHQPAFPAMMASAAASGFSLHGLAPFAAAPCTVMRGNPVSFQPPPDPRGRIDGFTLATGQASAVALHVAVLDGWDRPSGLRSSVRIEAAHARINDRHPGILVLSPGAASADSEQSLLMALQQSVQTAGRKNKGVLAVASVVSRNRLGQQPFETSQASVRLASAYSYMP